MKTMFYEVLGFSRIPSQSFLAGLLRQRTPEIFASPRRPLRRAFCVIWQAKLRVMWIRIPVLPE